MAWWITVYCRGDCSSLSPAELLAGIREEGAGAGDLAGYLAAAEECGVEEALVASALEKLHATSDLEVHYGTDRPVALRVWTDPDRVREETDEAREVRSPPAEAQPWLGQCQSIVGIELGFSMLEDTGIVLAYEIARFIARKYDGVAVDDEDEWYRWRDGRPPSNDS